MALFKALTLVPVLGNGETTSSFINSQILTDIGTLLNSVMGWITDNSYLVIFFTIGLVGAGIGIFRRLKKTVR